MVLAALFFVTALLYACVGFGGGSTYNALLILSGVDYHILPFVALTCNIIVVSGGVWHFVRAKHIKVKKILPWICCSIPAAWIGGYITVSEKIFIGVLGCALLLSGLRMLWPEKDTIISPCRDYLSLSNMVYVAPIVGTSLGFLAGITGIGGGIFLAPVLYFLHWSNAKNIAGTCSLFILVNSISGLLGQSMKAGFVETFYPAIQMYWYLFPLVLFGGQIGSWAGALCIDVRVIKKLTAILIIYVSLRLLYQFSLLV